MESGAAAAPRSVGCRASRAASMGSCRGLSGLVRLRLPATGALLAGAQGHLLQQFHLAEPDPGGLCRSSAPARARRHIVIDDAGCGDLCALPDADGIVDAHAPPENDEIADGHAPGDAGLGHQDAMATDHDIVADLNQIVDFGALADDRVAIGAAVDRGPRPDLDVVLQDDAADLRHFEMAAGTRHITEPVLSDAASRMNDDPIADQRMHERGSRADRAVAADAHGGPDDGARLEHGSRPDLGAWPDDGRGIDGHSLLEPCRRMHV